MDGGVNTLGGLHSWRQRVLARQGSQSPWGSRVLGATLLFLLLSAGSAVAVDPAPSPTAVLVDESGASVWLGNREIVHLRAIVLGRPPAQRAREASQALSVIVEQRKWGRVSVRAESLGLIVLVGEKGVLLLSPGDIEEGSGQTLPGLAGDVAGRLEKALAESQENRSVKDLLLAFVWSVLATLAFVLVLRGLEKLRIWVGLRFVSLAELLASRLDAAGFGFASARFLTGFARRVVWLVARATALMAAYLWLAFTLRAFAYTRPWGEQLRHYLTSAARNLALKGVAILPDLVVVVFIVIATRFLIRLADAFFDAVEAGRMRVSPTLAETVQPTRRISHAALWIFALIMAYPYLPGSGTDAFKGVSVVVGVMISLGSTTIVGQVLSGLMILYSRLFRVGDFIRVGDVEGHVTALGIFVTRIRTPWDDEVTLPNSVVAAATTRNYSRSDDPDGPLLSTRVTIGYDTPWRQVEALLRLAASRTRGLKPVPAPFVRQWSLGDFYVEYELNSRVERPENRVAVLADLHANIQDAFNEHGVQIMSPHYRSDPASAKVVPRERWFEPPADRQEPAVKQDERS